jgi:magnesium transporter
MVLFSADVGRHDRLEVQEHHLYLAGAVLVTIHHGPAPALDDLREHVAQDPELDRHDPLFLHYLVVNALVEDMFPVLDRVDERIDALEDSIVRRANRTAVAHVTVLRHAVSDLRRVLGPQRDVFQRLLTHSAEHSAGDLALYWRDVYEHLIRQYEQVESLRDLLTGTMDIYLTDMSNRQNATMKQLTVIASLFLPLTFLTGFFGMNFGFLVQHIAGPELFALGVSVMAICTALQLSIFRLRGWL